jgi:peptidoglycan lytic transglycosylase
MRRRALVAVALLLIALACAPRRRPVFVPEEPRLPLEGIASWYGPGFHGKRTSNGERFHQDDLTAAHCCWPFGLRVKVTLLSSGRSVVVRINDRMPANRKGRIIDLSRGAARAIGLIGPGTGRVRVEVP